MAFDLTARLDERRARQRFRQPTLMDGPCGRTAVVDGREHLNFCANDTVSNLVNQTIFTYET